MKESMYSSKENINIMTALLAKSGVRHAVVCPGSRNSAIVHNLNECEEIRCYPVTDERSAGFFALGICQCTHEPVVVCVTSGTALLNLLPAVAEAWYQHQPLVVVSGDRPPQWIDQLDGQTLPQADALGRFVRKAVSLPEPHNDEERWYCNRLVNEALIACRRYGGGPVHINVPLSEPLFEYGVPQLPDERLISVVGADADAVVVPQYIVDRFRLSPRPLILIGQLKEQDLPEGLCEQLSEAGYVVLHEQLSGGDATAAYMDEIVARVEGDDRFMPDCILYIGDTLVSKRTRKWLRKATGAACWAVSPDGEVHDVLMNLTGVIAASPHGVLTQLPPHQGRDFKELWDTQRAAMAQYHGAWEPPYSQMLAVKRFEEKVSAYAPRAVVHYANSTSVRLGNVFGKHYIYCNRGVNGIEGSLSVAAGYASVTDKTVYCVIGDLSFFYDQNALWNRNLNGNLRILLLNNGGGGIFRQLPGLEQSPATEEYVTASHCTNAEGICSQNHISYYHVDSEQELDQQIDALFVAHSDRPVLVEVVTDGKEDSRIYQEYIKTIKIWKENGKR